MNRRILLAGLMVVVPLLAVLVANLGRDPRRVESPLVGKVAPPFALRPVGGGARVTLDSLRGRPVVLNFWATWCAPCFEEHPVLTRAARDYGEEVRFLGVVYEDQEDNVRVFLGRQGSSYPALMDDGGRTAIAYGVYGVPETYFIDPAGRIAAKHAGPLDARELAANIRKASGPGGAR